VFKISFRDLRAHIGRYILTFFAVAIGVAFISGVLTLTDSITSTFDDLFADIFKGTDAQVRGEEAFKGDDQSGGETMRPRIDDSLVATVGDVPGVAAVEGSVSGFTQVIDKEGEPYGDPNFGAPTFGTSWGKVDELNPFHLVEGDAPSGPGEIVLDKKTADSTDYKVGDTAKYQTQAGVGDAKVVGIAKFGDADSPLGASFTMFDLATAQQLLAQPGKLDDINVVADSGVTQVEIRDRIADTLRGDDVEVVTGEKVTEENQSQLAKQFGQFRTFLLVFAFIAVFVGGFVIYTSFSFIVAQQQRQMALLRAVGASRRQVLLTVLLESFLVGVLGALTGYALGVGLAKLLSQLFSSESNLTLLPATFIISMLVGTVVTTASAFFPAYRASRIPPVAAMRDVAIDTSAGSRVRFGLGIAVLLLGIGSLVGGAAAGKLLILGLGMFLVFVAFVILGPIAARPGTTVISSPLPELRGIVGQLARVNAARNPKRTAFTASALMIGLGVVTLFLVMDSSFRKSIDKIVDDSFKGDFVVNTEAQMVGVGLPSSVAQDINQLPDVEDAAGIRYGFAEIDGSTQVLSGLDPGRAFRLFDVGVKAGDPEGLNSGGIAVSQKKADDEGWKVGDTIDVKFSETGDQKLTIAALIDDEQPFTQTYAIGTSTFEDNIPNSGDNLILVKLNEGVTTSQAKSSIEKIVDAYPTAKLQDLSEFKDATKSQLDFFLILMGVLLMLTILIAMIGIVNTLILSVVERTREIGLTRAVGAYRSQIRSAIRWEALIIAAFGLVAALTIGVFFGFVLIRNLGDQGIDVFSLPIARLIIVTIVTALLTLLAAVIPAVWAGRRPILAAIASE
jgi:putative ABC transport system permease protein